MSDLTSLQPLGSTTVLVEYDYEPGEAEQGNPERGNPGPGTPPAVYVLAASINAERVEADCFAPSVVAEWEENILRECTA